MAGSHPSADRSSILAGPSTDAQVNNIHLPLIPVACWLLKDIRFAFDSSVISSDAQEEMQILANLIRDHTSKTAGKPPISIFGHADPTGTDDYNKNLSGRRAAAVYGLLTRRTEVWEDLYSDGGQFARPVQGDKWGLKSIQTMLSALGFPATVDGQMGPQTSGAIRDFQTQNGLSASGTADSGTRKKLFQVYMDHICVDQSGAPYQLDKTTGFLGQNADSGGKGDFQGCSEFNPLLIFSEQETEEFAQDSDKTTRDLANQINRRVLILLFRPGSKVLTAKWPCPQAKADTTGCRKRFWSDGDSRRSRQLPAEDRKYEETKDTFACRFYDRLTHLSPCENTKQPLGLRWIGYVPKGMESQSSVILHDPQGQELARSDGTAYEQPGYDGVCQQFDFSLKPKSVNFKLSPVSGNDPISSQMFFRLQEILKAQQSLDALPQAVTVQPLSSEEEG